MKVCVVGASGKLGKYMVQHALDRGYEVAGLCRERSVEKLDAFKDRITVIPGATNDPEVVTKAVAGCDGVLTVLVPWGVHQYSSGTAQAVLDHAPSGARLVFSCGWHITRDGQDVYSRTFKWTVGAVGWLARLVRFVDLDDQGKKWGQIYFLSSFRGRPRLRRVTGWPMIPATFAPKVSEPTTVPLWGTDSGDTILISLMSLWTKCG
jgi:NAD(P)-dependent dehydrogenase (short-subunit alcohol dehydrogenase family)